MPFTWPDIQEGGYNVNGKTVVLLSGGLDSTTLLALAKFEDMEVLPLSIYYGQRHQHELVSAEAVCKHYGLELRGYDLSQPPESEAPIKQAKLFQGSSQTDDIDVPHGHYADESMRVTVVPNRNMILLAIATAYAISNGAERVAYAAHAGDHAIYPDCRPQFVSAMAAAMRLCHFTPVAIYTPFQFMSKADIVNKGSALQVPFHLTWSCYDPQPMVDGYTHCGKCGTCVERIEAFQVAGVPDPTEYATLVK